MDLGGSTLVFTKNWWLLSGSYCLIQPYGNGRPSSSMLRRLCGGIPLRSLREIELPAGLLELPVAAPELEPATSSYDGGASDGVVIFDKLGTTIASRYL